MSQETRSIRGKRALIVEEEFYSRWYIRRLLSPYTRCDVVVRGEEAVDVFRLSMDSGTPYALILLDMLLPEMDGAAVLREIRAIERRRSAREGRRAKIILITPDGELQEVPEQMRNQCEGLLPKPIDKSDLLYQLRSLGLISA